MQYQVPQFIEIEDKIFGPLTLKQFIWLAGGGGLCLLCFSVLPIYLTVLIAIPTVALSTALAFYTVNGRPFIVAVEHAFNYLVASKLYLWKPRTNTSVGAGQAPAPAVPAPIVPRLSESKLKDLSWSLNIKDRSAMGVSQTAERTGFEI